MFGRVYLGEIKKLIRPRGLIILGAILLLAAIIYAAIFEGIVQEAEMASAISAENFTILFFNILTGIVVIYAIVVAAGLYAEEYKRGTIKMVMLRPVSRSALTVAKLLAAFTYIGGIILSVTLLIFLYGWARYGSLATEDVTLFFNGETEYQATLGAKTAMAIFFNVLSVFFYMIVAFGIGTMSKKKTLGIVLTIVLEAGVFKLPFSLIDTLAETEFQRFLFSVNADLSCYFGTSTSIFSGLTALAGIPKGGNLYIALGALAVYLCAVLVPTFLLVEKRDVV